MKFIKCLPAIAALVLSLHTGAQNCSVIIAASQNSACAGYSVTLVATGANNYTWTGSSFSGSVTGYTVSVTAGTYTVLGTSSTCTATATFTVGLAPPLSISVTASSPTACMESNMPKYARSVTLTASGAGYYSWSPYDPVMMTYSIGPATIVRSPVSGCYTVVGTSFSCSGENTVCITVMPQFSVQVAPAQKTICAGEAEPVMVTGVSTLATGPSTAYTYQWAEPTGSTSLNGYTSATVIASPATAVTYTVEVKDANGCVSLPAQLQLAVDQCTGAREQAGFSAVSLKYDGVLLSVVCDRPVRATFLFDGSGRLVSQTNCADTGCAHDVVGIAPGLYILKAETSEGLMQCLKWMKL